MFTSRHLIAALAALSLGSAAWSQTLSKGDMQFLERAAQNGHAEVESSKLAQSKASSERVRSFAEHMVSDHTKAGEELKGLATAKGYKPPAEPSLRQKAQLKMLATLDGQSFDARYAEQMGVKAHEETVSLFERGAKEVQDPQVRAFATKTLPTLQEHLKMGKELHATTSKEAKTKDK